MEEISSMFKLLNFRFFGFFVCCCRFVNGIRFFRFGFFGVVI